MTNKPHHSNSNNDVSYRARNALFELDIIRFDPHPTPIRMQELRAEAVYTCVVQDECSDVLVDVRSVDHEVDYGNMILFLNRHRAYIRLLEHQGWTAREQTPTRGEDDEPIFFDETGKSFEVDPSETVSRPAALHTLYVWLTDGILSPNMDWIAE